MGRARLDAELRALEQDLLKMGRRVEQSVRLAVQALAEQDADLAQRIVETDVEINQMQRDLEERCYVLIATQQPAAIDLRIILSVVGIATDLERMGDHAEGIAKLAVILSREPLLKPLIDIPRMMEIACDMLRKELQAFVARDAEAAQEVAAADGDVDALYEQIFRELLVFMMNDPHTIRRATYLLWVAHNLERVADRATNIGERVLFLVTGQVEELNPKRSPRRA
ncbi:MAG: phosphate signaling complex protein PhoU [Anaerolineae bacterium]|nr:phosphate signaling complex protein PhoU [Anaerolineae bacterium]